jgi:hypothetical protein
MATYIIINHFKQSASKHALTPLRSKIRAAANSTFAIGGVSCSADSYVVL